MAATIYGYNDSTTCLKRVHGTARYLYDLTEIRVFAKNGLIIIHPDPLRVLVNFSWKVHGKSVHGTPYANVRKCVSRVFVLFQLFTRDKLVEIRRPKSVDVTESKEVTGKRKMEELHRNLYFTRVSWCRVENMENTATSDDLFIE